jgi:hypothetical protein
MDSLDPLSEESFRYASECRRLARLARKPVPPNTMGTVAYLRLLAWFKDLQMHVGSGWHPQSFSKFARSTRR